MLDTFTARKTIFSFFKCSKKMVFPKNRSVIRSFLYYRERWCFFFQKISSYFLEGKWKMIFLKKYMEIYFLQMSRIFFISRKIIFFWKNALIGDWHSRSHSRKSSNNSLYFYGDLHGFSYIALQWKENRKLNI